MIQGDINALILVMQSIQMNKVQVEDDYVQFGFSDNYTFYSADSAREVRLN